MKKASCDSLVNNEISPKEEMELTIDSHDGGIEES